MNFLRLPDVVEKTAQSAPTIWRKVKDRKFPQPVKIGPNTTVWVKEEVEDWMRARIEEARSGSRND